MACPSLTHRRETQWACCENEGALLLLSLRPFLLWVEVKASGQRGMTVTPAGRTIGNKLFANRPLSTLLLGPFSDACCH